jgi:hypothetical protein
VSDVDEAEQCAVRVRQAPQQAPGLVANVQVKADLETVQRLEKEPQRCEPE